MADGVVHQRDSIIVGTSVIGLSIASGTLGLVTLEQAVYASLGALGGFLITPDADHHKLTIEETRMGDFLLWFSKRTWGNNETTKKLAFVLNGIHKLFLAPYSIFIKHRSIWSHLPLLGTLIRIIYLYLMYSLIVIGIDSFESLFLGFIDLININTIIMYLTWSLQDLVHAYKDDFKFIW